MRKIEKSKAPSEFFKYFQILISSQKAALAWQPDQEGEKRTLYRVTFKAARKEEDLLKAECLERNRAFSMPEEEIFFYVESYRLLFKVSKINLSDRSLSARLPKELRILDDEAHEKILVGLSKLDPEKKDELLDYSRKKREIPPFEYSYAVEKQSERDKAIFEQELSFVSLDEEDKLYKDKRDAPRARPPEGKMVSMGLADLPGQKSSYSLFDLSRGGLAVLAFSENDYKNGDIVHIYAFDDQVLDDPMVAEVKNVRQADDQGMQFKVGMQFL